MRYIALLIALALPVAAWAQQKPAEKSPELQATEQMLLSEMTAHRDMTARVIELTAQNASLQTQLDLAKKKEAAAPSEHSPAK